MHFLRTLAIRRENGGNRRQYGIGGGEIILEAAARGGCVRTRLGGMAWRIGENRRRRRLNNMALLCGVSMKAAATKIGVALGK